MCIKLFIHSSWISPTPVTSFIWSWASGTSARPRHVLARPCWLSIRTHESARIRSCCTSGSTRWFFWGSKLLDKPKSKPLRCSETPSGSTNQRLKQKKLLGHVCTNVIQSKSPLDFKSLGWSSPWLDYKAHALKPSANHSQCLTSKSNKATI